MSSKAINIHRKSLSAVFVLFACVEAISFTSRAAVPIPGLVSYWAADGNGNDSADGNTAFLQGGASFGPGISGQAFTFDGANAYVSVPASANLNVGLGSGFTISTWVNPAKMTIQPLLEWNSGS